MEHWLYLLVSNPQTLFTALAAMATVAAVITSLYVANRKPKGEAQVKLSIERVLVGNIDDPTKPHDMGYIVHLVCTNMNHTPIYLDAYGYSLYVKQGIKGFYTTVKPAPKLYLGQSHSSTWVNSPENKRTSGNDIVGDLISAYENKYCTFPDNIKHLEKNFRKMMKPSVQTTLPKLKSKLVYDEAFFRFVMQFKNDEVFYKKYVIDRKPQYSKHGE